MHIREFIENDRSEVIALWGETGLISQSNDPNNDIDRKMESGADLFLVGVVAEKIIATVMGGYDGHRGWAYYVCVSKSMQRKGYATLILQELEKRLLEKGCPKLNLMIRTTNSDVVDFYFSTGFKRDDVMTLGKRLISD